VSGIQMGHGPNQGSTKAMRCRGGVPVLLIEKSYDRKVL
jgi:hypothetical protein